MGKTIAFQRPDGGECGGYYVEPAPASTAPGMVVLQEWWGLNTQIKGVADRLAAAGYRTLVPDLYRGKQSLDAKESEHLMKSLDFSDVASQDVRGAVRYLKSGGGRAGVTGFCMGGALTLLSSMAVPEADAAVTWYGFPPIELIDASKIRIPVLGHFATEDAFFPLPQAKALEEKLEQANVDHQFHYYAAQHAFANGELKDTSIPAKYDAGAAELAWQRTLEFLKQHLG